MIFQMCRPYLNGGSWLIEEREFDLCLDARELILQVLAIEDMFSLLAKSYIDFENTIFAVGSRYTYELGGSEELEDYFRDSRDEISLSVFALLTAANSFTERLKSCSENLVDKGKVSGERTCSSERLNQAFDSRLEFEVMDRLRNVAVHQGKFLGRITFGGKRIWDNSAPLEDAASIRQYTIDPKFDVQSIVSSTKFKRSTADKIKKLNCTSLDVKFFVRGYVEELTCCLADFRENTQDALEIALTDLESVTSKYAALQGIENSSFSLITFDTDNFDDAKLVDAKHFKKHAKKRERWNRLKNCQWNYVSNQIVSETGKYPLKHQNLFID